MYIKKFLGAPTAGDTYKMARNTDGGLSEVYHDFINPVACCRANPYSSTFWREMSDWLEYVSKQAEGYQKAIKYRDQLSPYRLRRVNLIADYWNVANVFDNTVQLCLTNVHLAHVYDQAVGCAPNVFIDHIHILVSKFWLDRIAPAQDEGLSVNGMLYEYVNSKSRRNIGIMGVAVMPRNRKAAGERAMPEPGEYAA